MPKSQPRGQLRGEQLRDVEQAALLYVSTHGSITNREIRSLTGINYDQAIWFFNEMLRGGTLQRTGTASTTRYVMPDGSEPGEQT
jgi:hypothetical protein